MDKLKTKLLEFEDESTIEVDLTTVGSWKETKHAVVKKDILAMIAAMGSERALLLTGDPGVGKSHLARVAASITERYFISTVIKPDDEIGDLLWSIDHTQRLSDAQLQAALKKEFNPSLKSYLRPGPIWHAFQEPEGFTSHYKPASQEASRKNGVVLLIDEIDKASVTLLNSLLEVLGNMSFEVPLLEEPIDCRKTPPLIILTSNGDELPAPLKRRCVCHEVTLPKTQDEFVERMNMIALAKMGDNYSKPVSDACANLIYEHRAKTITATGASEFVDLIHTLHEIEPDDETKQIEKHLPDLSQYFLKS